MFAMRSFINSKIFVSFVKLVHLLIFTIIGFSANVVANIRMNNEVLKHEFIFINMIVFVGNKAFKKSIIIDILVVFVTYS